MKELKRVLAICIMLFTGIFSASNIYAEQVTFTAGIDDDYTLPDEPVMPLGPFFPPAILNGKSRRHFDEKQTDASIFHTFKFKHLQGKISGASISFQAMPIGQKDHNDGIQIYPFNIGSIPAGSSIALYHAFLGEQSEPGNRGLQDYAWNQSSLPTYAQAIGANFTLNLAALPGDKSSVSQGSALNRPPSRPRPAIPGVPFRQQGFEPLGRPPVDLIPVINNLGFLDIQISDDSVVDSLTLSLEIDQ